MTFIRGPGGYAVPAAPIPIVFPDVDINGDEDGGTDGSKAPNAVTTLPPPAYGLWRSSVRVNPDQFYWVRRGGDDTPPPMPVEMEGTTPPPPPLADPEPVGRRVSMAPAQVVYRPPSYSSEDGVEYVLGGPRLPRTAVLAAPTPAGELGIHEMEGGDHRPREHQQGRSAPSSREQSPSGTRRLA